MPSFSLICPSRDRIYSLRRLFESLVHTTCYHSDIEIIVVIDNDDPTTKGYLEATILTRQYPTLNIKYVSRERSEFLNRDYYNYGASFTTGDFLWCIGDDCDFKVVNWDVKIRHHLNTFLESRKDKVICAGIRDNTPKPKPDLPQFPCFPLFTRQAYQTVGFLLHPNIPVWGADYLIYLLYSGVNRYLPIDDDEYLHHIGIHTKTGPKDSTALSIEDRFRKFQFVPEHNIDRHKNFEIPVEIERLKQQIINLGGTI